MVGLSADPIRYRGLLQTSWRKASSSPFSTALLSFAVRSCVRGLLNSFPFSTFRAAQKRESYHYSTTWMIGICKILCWILFRPQVMQSKTANRIINPSTNNEIMYLLDDRLQHFLRTIFGTLNTDTKKQSIVYSFYYVCLLLGHNKIGIWNIPLWVTLPDVPFDFDPGDFNGDVSSLVAWANFSASSLQEKTLNLAPSILTTASRAFFLSV